MGMEERSVEAAPGLQPSSQKEAPAQRGCLRFPERPCRRGFPGEQHLALFDPFFPLLIPGFVAKPVIPPGNVFLNGSGETRFKPGLASCPSVTAGWRGGEHGATWKIQQGEGGVEKEGEKPGDVAGVQQSDSTK